MDIDGLPETAFVAPGGENRDAAQALLQQGMERVLNHLASAAGQRPLPQGEAALPELLPDGPVAEAEILDRLDGLLAASVNASAPGWTGPYGPAAGDRLAPRRAGGGGGQQQPAEPARWRRPCRGSRSRSWPSSPDASACRKALAG